MGADAVTGSSFDVRRGEFTIPPELLEDGAEYELSRYFGQQLPEGCTSITRHVRAGVTVVHWVKVRFVGWYDEDGVGPSLHHDAGSVTGQTGLDVRDDSEQVGADLERDALGIARIGSL